MCTRTSHKLCLVGIDVLDVVGVMFSKLSTMMVRVFFFFFQAEDGIRDLTVTGVQTCALPIFVLVGRDEPDAVFLPEALIERIAVVGAVADHSFWFGSREALGDSGFDEFRFMRRSAGDAAGDRKTMAVCDRHDFTAFSSASRADSRAPFFAELKLASVKVSDRSSLPRVRKSSASACKSRSSVPSRCHC